MPEPPTTAPPNNALPARVRVYFDIKVLQLQLGVDGFDEFTSFVVRLGNVGFGILGWKWWTARHARIRLRRFFENIHRNSKISWQPVLAKSAFGGRRNRTKL
jgi:hypothetical protein